MSTGVKDPVVAWGETAEPEGAPMSVRRSARHCALPGVGAGQTASTLEVCGTGELASEGAAAKNGAASAPSARTAAVRRFSPEILTKTGPPHLTMPWHAHQVRDNATAVTVLH